MGFCIAGLYSFRSSMLTELFQTEFIWMEVTMVDRSLHFLTLKGQWNKEFIFFCTLGQYKNFLQGKFHYIQVFTWPHTFFFPPLRVFKEDNNPQVYVRLANIFSPTILHLLDAFDQPK